MRFQWVLACLAVAPVLMSASEPVRLKPASKWVLDYGENSCRLLRTFGDPAEPTLLLFERASPTSPLSMVVIGKALKTPADKEEVAARFLPDAGLKFDHGQVAKSATGKDPAVLWPHVDFISDPELKVPHTDEPRKAMKLVERGERPEPRDLEKLASIRRESEANAARVVTIEITARRNRPLTLETGSLGRPIKMLDDCSRHQLKGWGIDPSIEDKIARPAWAPAPYKWFSDEDYPAGSVARGEQSLVEARLLIDAEGKITGCTALSHVDAPAFQKAVCSILTRRGKYLPAELADGTKVPSYATLSIRFVLPR